MKQLQALINKAKRAVGYSRRLKAMEAENSRLTLALKRQEKALKQAKQDVETLQLLFDWERENNKAIYAEFGYELQGFEGYDNAQVDIPKFRRKPNGEAEGGAMAGAAP